MSGDAETSRFRGAPGHRLRHRLRGHGTRRRHRRHRTLAIRAHRGLRTQCHLEVVEDCSTFSERDDCRRRATNVLRDNARGHANVLAVSETVQPEGDELRLVAEVYSCPARALLEPAQELRLELGGWGFEQRVAVVEVRDHELVYRLDRNYELPFGEIKYLEVRVPDAESYKGIGALIGGALPVVGGAVAYGVWCRGDQCDGLGKLAVFAWTGLAAIAGTLLGGWIGYLVSDHPQWEKVNLPKVRE